MSFTFIFIEKNGCDDNMIDNAICPLCKKPSSYIDIYDYVDENVVIHCEKHDEILLCFPPVHNELDSEKLFGGEIKEDCIKLANKNDVIEFYKNCDIPEIIKNYLDEDYLIYKCFAIKINKLVSTNEDIFENIDESYFDQNPQLLDMYYHDVDIISFSETNCDTSHDGMNLYYCGTCTGCNKNYKSHIWGD